MKKVTVLGSCVSRISLLNAEKTEHGFYNGDAEGIALEYFLDKHNMMLATLKPPFTREEVDTIKAETLFDPSACRSLKQQLNKDTIPMLLNGEAEFLIIDLYEFHGFYLTYNDTAFCSQANEFFNTELGIKTADSGLIHKFMYSSLPMEMIFSGIDQFFETIKNKFDSNHIILNRFRANTYMLYKNGQIGFIPDVCKRDFQCHEKYNDFVFKIEEYIINKYNPWVIDISKFFMGDANYWDNWNASHFEKEFYRETYRQIVKIINGQTDIRYYDKVQFFKKSREGYNEDMSRPYDIEFNLRVLELLLSNGDDLWLNVLEQLYIRAPQNERLIEIMTTLGLPL